MSHQLLCILALAAFMLAVVVYAAMSRVTVLASAMSALILSVPLIGTEFFTVAQYSSNVGNIPYAGVMFGLALKYLRYGALEARQAVKAMMVALVMVFGSMAFLDECGLLATQFHLSTRIVGASFTTFYLVQSLFIWGLHRTPVWAVPLVTIAAQALDSAVFFPLAFATLLPPDTVLEFAIVGFLTKAGIAVLSVPFLWGFVRWLHPLPPSTPPSRTTIKPLAVIAFRTRCDKNQADL